MYWIQIRDLTLASIRARYRKTLAGFIWVILNPLLQFGVQSLVFRKFLRLDIPDYHLFLLGGLLPWIFISSTISMGTPVFVSYSHLLRSFKISPLVILCSKILDNFINFLATVVIILIPLFFRSEGSYLMILALPLAIIPLLITTSALTIYLAVLNVFYRDTNFVVGFILSLLFFLTPVFYPREFVPDTYRWIIDVNPFMYIIEPFRILFLGSSWVGFFTALLKGFGVSAIAGGLATFALKRKRNAFYFKL